MRKQTVPGIGEGVLIDPAVTEAIKRFARDWNGPKTEIVIGEMTPGVCRVCGCTETNACVGLCSWYEPTLCSTCVELMSDLFEALSLDIGPSGSSVRSMALGVGKELIRLATLSDEEIEAERAAVTDAACAVSVLGPNAIRDLFAMPVEVEQPTREELGL